MFIHLKLKSIYSLLEGAIFPKDLAKKCLEFNMPAVGISDRGNLFGALEFSEIIADHGVQPIIGCQLPINLEGISESPSDNLKNAFMVFIAKNEVGYSNLINLSSEFHLNESNKLNGLALEKITDRSDGIICMSGGVEGPINRLFGDTKEKLARILTERLIKIFGDRFYFELNRHPSEEARKEKAAYIEELMLRSADFYNIPLVATNDVYFLNKSFYEPHDALLCIADGNYVDQKKARRSLSQDHFFKSQEQMKELFKDIPEAITNTVEIAKRCSFRPEPRDAILPKFSTDANNDLMRQSSEGLEKRFRNMKSKFDKDIYYKRLKFELDVIRNMGFSGYFLIVADIVIWAKKRGIPVGPGRGSGAGSLVAYSLTITNLDPLKYSLLFERFLNPSRISMPDFDIDFCMDRRNEIIEYVQQKYGKDNVAQIITFGALWSKAAVRDIGRVLQLPYSRVDKISKLIPVEGTKPMGLSKALEKEKDLIQEAASDPQVDRMLKIARELEGVLRNASTHAAGIVIGDRKLVDLVPLYQDPRSDMPATQFTKDWVERAGLVKFDFLGLKTLTIIKEAVSLINDVQGIKLDIDEIPLDDLKTFEIYSDARTFSVFQVESKGMRDALIDLRPNSLEDIIALVALYRPGPMENIPAFCEAKNDPERRQYLHKSIDHILDETHGIIVYQEQVMEIAQRMADYSLGEADLLRKAMGKKIKEVMDSEKPKFLKGAEKNKIQKTTAEGIWNLLAKFADYGFNKSHAAAYGVLSYQTAYLKRHFTPEFMTAALNSDIQNIEKFSRYYDDLVDFEIILGPPCINKSDVKFSVKNGEIIFGLGAIKNVGMDVMSKIVENRERGGPFEDIFDFARRVNLRKVGKRPMEMLITSGAYDSFSLEKEAMLEKLEELVNYSAACHEEKHSDQVNLFEDHTETLRKPNFFTENKWSFSQKVKEIYDVTGVYFISPYKHQSEFYESIGIKPYDTFEKTRDEIKTILVSGYITSVKSRVTNNGKQYFLVKLIDHTNKGFEVFIFPERLSAYGVDIEVEKYVLLVCEKSKDQNGFSRVSVKSVRDLEKFLKDRERKRYHLVISPECKIGKLSMLLEEAILEKSSKEGNVLITVKSETNERDPTNISLPNLYDISSDKIEDLRSVEGVYEVRAD